MKKILLLIPILGICSSLLAQAPQVLNVNANQVDGTKDVQIDFDITNKTDYSGELNVEVWYRTSPDQTQWERAWSLWSSADYPLPSNDEFITGADGEEMVTYSHRIPAGGDYPTVRNIYWKAGDDAHDVKTDQAQVRVIVFYNKEGPDGAAATPKDQVSGWDGFDDGSTAGDTGGDTGGDGGESPAGLSVYYFSTEAGGAFPNPVAEGHYIFVVPNASEPPYLEKVYEEAPAGSGNWLVETGNRTTFPIGFEIDQILYDHNISPVGTFVESSADTGTDGGGI